MKIWYVLFKLAESDVSMLFYPAVHRIRSCMQDANTLCWHANPTRKRQSSIYESSSLSWHSGMLSLFDSLIRINHVYVSFFVSLFLLMLFMRLYLARMRLHIIRVTVYEVFALNVVLSFSRRATLFSFQQLS